LEKNATNLVQDRKKQNTNQLSTKSATKRAGRSQDERSSGRSRPASKSPRNKTLAGSASKKTQGKENTSSNYLSATGKKRKAPVHVAASSSKKSRSAAKSRFDKAHENLFKKQESILERYDRSKTPRKPATGLRKECTNKVADKKDGVVKKGTKFDLQASLRRPITWEMKRGPLK